MGSAVYHEEEPVAFVRVGEEFGDVETTEEAADAPGADVAPGDDPAAPVVERASKTEYGRRPRVCEEHVRG